MSEPLTPLGVGDLADSITTSDDEPRAVHRVGLVTAVESTGLRRVQVNVAGTTWCNRLQDISLAVGDRVSVLQQGNVMLVIGRLSGYQTLAPIGSILLFAGSAVPNGWLSCVGGVAVRADFLELFAVIGTTYGAGNGTTTFGIPNLSDRFPVGAGNSYSRGNTGGANSVALTASEMPFHTHNQVSGSWLIGASVAGGGASEPALHNAGAETGGAGNGDDHENRPPYLALNFIIRAL